MVYNAMKLFMEINPQLFDDCSQDYNELQNSAASREQARLSKWDKLQEQADKRKQGTASAKTNGKTLETVSESDATQDSQQRLDALKLHDESNDAAKQQSVCALVPCSFSLYLPSRHIPYTKLSYFR